MPDIPAFEEKISSEPPKVHYNTDYNPFKVSAGGGGGGSYSRSKVEWEDLYGGLTKASKMNNPQPEPEMDYWRRTGLRGRKDRDGDIRRFFYFVCQRTGDGKRKSAFAV